MRHSSALLGLCSEWREAWPGRSLQQTTENGTSEKIESIKREKVASSFIKYKTLIATAIKISSQPTAVAGIATKLAGWERTD